MRLTGDTRLLDIDQVRLEHALRSLESFRTDLNDSTIGKLLERVISDRKKAEERNLATHFVVFYEAGSLL
jgi:hypothetical protein